MFFFDYYFKCSGIFQQFKEVCIFFEKKKEFTFTRWESGSYFRILHVPFTVFSHIASEEQLASEASLRLLWSVHEALAISSHANAVHASECVLSLLTLFANQEACERQESVKRSCVWYPRSQPSPLCEHMLILQPFNFQSACRSLLFLLLVCYSAGPCVALSTYRLR